MESDAADSASGTNVDVDGVAALNSTILEYYKKFGRKRDLEQYFALNTAQGDIRDLSSLFWRKMKSQESSDSGEKSRESSLEVCKISIRCSALEVDPGSSQDEKEKSKESESPPIIVEEVTTPPGTSRHSDNESVKSDDYQSQKSTDVGLDTSMNKALSPTSSVTSQRRLEWDSLADVGYANESDKKTSVSSLSTLERLALQQQYSNNDTKQANLMGAPTAHSTPVDENETKAKNRRGSKTTKIYRKDVDFVEVNLPHTSNANPSQSINFNLTKHISLNVDNSGVSVENVKKDLSYVPEKRSIETEMTPQASCDKEIQTSLVKSDKSSSSDIPKTVQLYGQAVPVLINLNTYKKRHRRKKFVAAKKKLRSRKKQDDDKENLPIHEKSNEQVSEAESFEYMPGHIYNQNRINKQSTDRSSQLAESNLTAGNKSSLESSGAVTTDSSKDTKLSFSKDLENSIKLLKATLNQRYDDSELKQKLIKKVVQRLLRSSYRDDESSTDFLSGLSFSSKKIGLREGNTTTSTSDANNTTNEKPKPTRPKKSILRADRFNANGLPSTSQSAPNLAVATNSEKPVNTDLPKTSRYPNTESDSSKEKTSSDNAFAKTSSEELYQKYLDALRREEAYKRHLKEKEILLKTKLVCSDVPINVPARLSSKSQLRLKEIMNDLTKSNYGSEAARLDGSGDAGKLELGSVSSSSIRPTIRTEKSHSVFTLSSSGNSDPNRRANLKKNEMKDIPKADTTKEGDHYCCCPHHYKNKLAVNDSSVQVDLKCDDSTRPKNSATDSPRRKCAKCIYQPITLVPDEISGEIKYLCMCGAVLPENRNVDDNLLVYKCSRLMDQGVQSQAPSVIIAVSSKPTTTPRRFDCKGSQTGLKESDSATTTKRRIHEAIRIIQTDISINPRISDPSISDIKIINTSDCVKLVGEQYREVSKTSVESKSSADDQTDLKIEENKNMARSGEAIGTGIDDVSPRDSRSCKSDVQVQSDRDLVRETVYGSARRFADNVTVQAANVTQKPTSEINQASAADNCVKCNQASNYHEIIRREKSGAIDMIFPRKEPSIRDVFPRPQSTSSEPTPQPKNITPRSTSPGPYSKAVDSGQTKPVSRSTSPLSHPKDEHRPDSPKKSASVSTDLAQYEGLAAYSQEKTRETAAKNLATKSSNQVLLAPDSPKRLPCDKKSTVVTKDPDKVSSPTVSHKITPRSPQKSQSNINLKFKSQTYPQKLDAKKSRSSRSHSLGESEAFQDEMFIELGKRTAEFSSHVSGSSEEHQIGDSTSRERKQTSTSGASSQKKDSKDLIMDLIQDITSRYKKKDLEKSQKRKCFKEIISVLKYLLDTEDTDAETVMGLRNLMSSSTSDIEQPKASDGEVRSSCSDYCETKTKLSNKEYIKPFSEKSQISKAKARSGQSQNMKAKQSEQDDLKTKSSPRKKEYQIMQAEEENEKEKPPEKKVLVDKGVQLSSKRSKPVRCHTESSDLPISSEFPGTSSESATCHVLNRIRRECDKYHQRRCKCHNAKKCECFTTSVNCDQCKRIHYCICRTHSKCKHKSKNCERSKRKCVAYNLIIQTSESMVDEARPVDKTSCPLKNIVVKVPSRKKSGYQEVNDTFLTKGSPRSEGRRRRSRSLPNDSLTSEENVRANIFCVKDYLEKNRPDFIERSTNRQSRLKMISETSPTSFQPCIYCYPCPSCPPYNPRPMKTVIVHSQNQHGVSQPCTSCCREPPSPYHPCHDPCILCNDSYKPRNDPYIPCNDTCNPCNDPCDSRLLFNTRCPFGPPFLPNQVNTIEPPKLLSEREMKQHSSRIYRRLPEVLRKKDEAKKESVKKTNLLMANIFKKSLQKKALRGAVNLSNYSTVIKF